MKYIAIFLFVAMLSHTTFADYSVGVSPPVKEYVIGPGEEQLVTFSIATISGGKFVVSLEAEEGTIDFFNKNEYRSYVYEYSEQPAKQWATLFSSVLEFEQTSQGPVKGARDVTFLVRAPENAEPGYHVITIKAKPFISETAIGGVGTQLVGLTTFNALIRVPGEARREGIILDSIPANFRKNAFDISTYFKNTGTVTMRARAVNRLYSNEGGLVGEFSSPFLVLSPEEQATFLAPVNGIGEGEYTLSTTVNYETGYQAMDFRISVPQEAEKEAAPEAKGFPVLLLATIVIVAVLAVIVFYKKYRNR